MRQDHVIDLFNIIIRKEKVMYYPYRRAFVIPTLTLRLEREQYDEIIKQFLDCSEEYFDTRWNQTIKPHYDNHICFSIGDKMYIMFTDSEIHIGTEINIHRW